MPTPTRPIVANAPATDRSRWNARASTQTPRPLQPQYTALHTTKIVMLRASLSTENPRIMSRMRCSIFAAKPGANRGNRLTASENRTVRTGHSIANTRNTSRVENPPSVMNAVAIIQCGELSLRCMKNVTNTSSEIIRPSTMRSTATVPSAADAVV